MGLLGRLFGKKKDQPYVDAGTALTDKLAASLNLKDWEGCLPKGYRPDEVEAIDRRLSDFQRIANKEVGGEAKFHPDVVPKVQRILVGEALTEFAGNQWKYSDEIPVNWPELASTYLKAWISRLDPQTLLHLGDLLVKVGRCSEAKEVFKVVLLFPTYANTMWGGADKNLLNEIVGRAKEALQGLD